jgi:ribonuclease HI
VPDGPFASGFDARTTNQRMEITAALEALRALLPGSGGTMTVVSDSTYVVNCFRDRWWEGWRRRNWLNTAKKPVANRDLWEPLLELALDPAVSITWQWVKGHSGDRYNDEVDRLAVEAAVSGSGTDGSGVPVVE